MKEKSPTVLSKLAEITTIRDTEAFEFSVLKTLSETFKTPMVSCYKLNDKQMPTTLLQYSVEHAYSSSMQRIDETRVLHLSDFDVPDYLRSAQQWIITNNKPYVTTLEDQTLVVYPVIGHVSVAGYVVIHLQQTPTETEHFAITCILRIYHNFLSLLEENQKDKLTGLLNRKTFDDCINKIQAAASADAVVSFDGDKRKPTTTMQQFWMAVVDVDYFKKINDKYGHVYGDEVLILITQIMRQTFRSTDLLFRFGGEEFVVIIRMDNKHAAQQLFTRFHAAVAAYDFPKLLHVTVSMGITQITEAFMFSSAIVERADIALYYAKEHGRNQLHFYEDLLEDNKIDVDIEIGTIDIF